jgi:uncharacterized protein (DUF427 family)
MMKAIWNNTVVAESDDTIVVEGNHYFPATSIKREYFKQSDLTSVCSWKGEANYYDIEVNGKTNKDAAWFYATPKTAAKHIAGYIAFWKGVSVS